MSLAGYGKEFANRWLSPFNVKIDSLTATRAEEARLSGLASRGHFDMPILPVLPQFAACDPGRILSEIRKGERRFALFAQPGGENGFELNNDYYATPDAEVAYAIVHLFKPRRIVEIGSGNSTRLLRAAVKDAGLDTRLTSIDPSPRRDVSAFADEIIRERVEDSDCSGLFAALEANDILFLDSSHHAGCGTDVTSLLLSVLPTLRGGVAVHLHDIFLSYEYPIEWVRDFAGAWNEQYLLQALLTDNLTYEVLWPGYYLQRTLPDFSSRFQNWKANSRAQSFWLVGR